MLSMSSWTFVLRSSLMASPLPLRSDVLYPHSPPASKVRRASPFKGQLTLGRLCSAEPRLGQSRRPAAIRVDRIERWPHGRGGGVTAGLVSERADAVERHDRVLPAIGRIRDKGAHVLVER